MGTKNYTIKSYMCQGEAKSLIAELTDKRGGVFVEKSMDYIIAVGLVESLAHDVEFRDGSERNLKYPEWVKAVLLLVKQIRSYMELIVIATGCAGNSWGSYEWAAVRAEQIIIHALWCVEKAYREVSVKDAFFLEYIPALIKNGEDVRYKYWQNEYVFDCKQPLYNAKIPPEFNLKDDIVTNNVFPEEWIFRLIGEMTCVENIFHDIIKSVNMNSYNSSMSCELLKNIRNDIERIRTCATEGDDSSIAVPPEQGHFKQCTLFVEKYKKSFECKKEEDFQGLETNPFQSYELSKEIEKFFDCILVVGSPERPVPSNEIGGVRRAADAFLGKLDEVVFMKMMSKTITNTLYFVKKSLYFALEDIGRGRTSCFGRSERSVDVNVLREIKKKFLPELQDDCKSTPQAHEVGK